MLHKTKHVKNITFKGKGPEWLYLVIPPYFDPLNLKMFMLGRVQDGGEKF